MDLCVRIFALVRVLWLRIDDCFKTLSVHDIGNTSLSLLLLGRGFLGFGGGMAGSKDTAYGRTVSSSNHYLA